MEENDKLVVLCKNGNLRFDQLFDLLLSKSEWMIYESKDMKNLLDAMGAYAIKNHITNFYELAQRFTLSECFGEDEL